MSLEVNLSEHAELVRLRKENEQLRMEREILIPTRGTRKGRSLLCERSRIKYGFIREQQKTYTVTALCRVMQVSSSAFYAWAKPPESSGKTKEKVGLEAKLCQIFDDNKQVYGSRRISKELKKIGIIAGRYKVRSLMVQMGLEVRYPKRFKVTTDSNHNEAISPNTLNRNFDVVAPNLVWTTDTGAPCGYYLRLDIRRLALCRRCD